MDILNKSNYKNYVQIKTIQSLAARTPKIFAHDYEYFLDELKTTFRVKTEACVKNNVLYAPPKFYCVFELMKYAQKQISIHLDLSLIEEYEFISNFMPTEELNNSSESSLGDIRIVSHGLTYINLGAEWKLIDNHVPQLHQLDLYEKYSEINF